MLAKKVAPRPFFLSFVMAQKSPYVALQGTIRRFIVTLMKGKPNDCVDMPSLSRIAMPYYGGCAMHCLL
jgi:hypothetical protein